MRAALRPWLEAAADVLLPAICPGCRSAEGPELCPACLAALPALEHPCPWCGEPRGSDDERCPACRARGFPHVAAVAVRWRYADLVEQLVGDAKAGAQPAAARALAAIMPGVAELLDGPAVAVPVPPSGRRSGPHLGTRLAAGLARRHGLPLRRLLRTTRFAAAQHGLGAAERERNVAGLFRSAPVPTPTVVLVDDLLTSGATASAAAAALRVAGARRVVLACLARTAARRRRPVADAAVSDGRG